MAGVIRKSVFSLASKLAVHGSRQLLLQSGKTSGRISVQSAIATRNLWKFSTPSTIRALAAASRTCGCGLHTEVDKEVSKFLEKEIEFEESGGKSKLPLPKIKGFDVSSDGSDVTLVKKMGNETITVKFNINGSADSDQPPLGDTQGESQDDNPQMVSKPPFQVEINKGAKQILAVQCSFTSEDIDEQDPAGQDAEAIVDLFEIQEVAIHSGDWNESVYTLPAETMDGNLYDLLMDLLDERGISDEFINSLIEFSTTYEHGKYVDFLKTLKGFVEKN